MVQPLVDGETVSVGAAMALLKAAYAERQPTFQVTCSPDGRSAVIVALGQSGLFVGRDVVIDLDDELPAGKVRVGRINYV